MKEKKLNDTEIDVGMIIKALECMAGITQGDCDKCPFMIDKFCSDTELSKTTLDLIHRLQVENATLKSELKKRACRTRRIYEKGRFFKGYFLESVEDK